jgi:hypothetical protein
METILMQIMVRIPLHKARPGAHPIILPKHRRGMWIGALLNRVLLGAGLDSSDTKKKLL